MKNKTKEGLKAFDDFIRRQSAMADCRHEGKKVSASALRGGQWVEVEKCAICDEVVP